MAKLDALKEKISGIRGKIGEKLDKIAFFRKRKEAAQAGAPADPYSLKEIYRHGSVGTRLQIIFIYLLGLSALAATFHAGRVALKQFGATSEHKQIAKDYSRGLEEMSQKVLDNAKIVSLGNFTSAMRPDSGNGRFFGMDVWARVSDAEAAQFVQNNDNLVRDAITEALSAAATDPLDPVSEKGKIELKSRMQEELNKILKKGRVEEIFFQNFIVQ